ncbi:MAG: glycoside hydrolase family 13 protein, partial [Eubacteriales bacterium]
MQFIYNAWDETYKKPFGAVKKGEAIALKVITDADMVRVVGLGDSVAMEKDADGFTLRFTPEKEKGLYFYHFEAVFGDQTRRFGKSEDSGEACENGRDYQLTVHSNAPVPEWFKGKTMYQIYVDRFFKGDTTQTRMREHVLMHTSWDEDPVYIKNDRGEIVLWDFFGGNLAGVIEKLPYIKDLGVDIIYLNPIFEAVSNHKYDTADYASVDRMYGTDEVLKSLVKKAEALDIKIMLDGVFSHTGEDSIYFNKYKHYGDGGAYNDKQSPYYPWYHFKKFPDEYDCWWGVKALPAVNELDPTYMHYLLDEKDGAVTQWMRAGVAGWRLDVADELPDAFIRALKDCVLKVNPEAVLLGEVWEDASNKVSYETPREYILGDALDSVSNYPLRDALIDMLTGRGNAKEFSGTVMMLQEN